MNFSLIPAAINHFLQPEPQARRRLAAHAGKTATIDAGVATLRLQITPDGLLQSAEDGAGPGAANVVIHIKPADLPLIMQDRARAFSRVRIEGDAEFASTIASVAQSVRWHAEEDASRLFGDIAGRRLTTAAHAVASTIGATQRQLAENVAEYFLEENPMLIRPSAVTEFTDEVSRLRDDLERLAKRVDKLAARRGAGAA